RPDRGHGGVLRGAPGRRRTGTHRPATRRGAARRGGSREGPAGLGGGGRRAAVTPFEPLPGVVELAGYYTGHGPAAAPDKRAVHDHLRGRLPRHMVPTYLKALPAMPILPGGKTDRKHLPEPARA